MSDLRGWYLIQAEDGGRYAVMYAYRGHDDTAFHMARLAAHFGRLALGQTRLVVDAELPSAEDVLGILRPGYRETPLGG